MSNQIITIVQAIISVLLIISILMQKQSSGLGSGFGGSGESYHEKRGMQKTLFYSTIILAALFIGVGILRLLI